jgi:hypothetical protein
VTYFSHEKKQDLLGIKQRVLFGVMVIYSKHAVFQRGVRIVHEQLSRAYLLLTSQTHQGKFGGMDSKIA